MYFINSKFIFHHKILQILTCDEKIVFKSNSKKVFCTFAKFQWLHKSLFYKMYTKIFIIFREIMQIMSLQVTFFATKKEDYNSFLKIFSDIICQWYITVYLSAAAKIVVLRIGFLILCPICLQYNLLDMYYVNPVHDILTIFNFLNVKRKSHTRSVHLRKTYLLIIYQFYILKKWAVLIHLKKALILDI